MSNIFIIEIILVIVLGLVTIISALHGWLAKQLPLCKIFVYVGIIILTILDLLVNNSNTKVGIGMAVIFFAFFEIMSNIRTKSKKCNIKNNIVWKKTACVIFIAIFLFVVPFIVYYLLKIPVFAMHINNDWVGFFGSYMGALIGAAITLAGVKMTINHENKVRNEEYIKKMMPVLSEKIQFLTYKELENWNETRGAFFELHGEQAGNGEAFDKSTIEKYLKSSEEEIMSKNKFVQYNLKNLSQGAATNISLTVNGSNILPQFSILPNDEMKIVFVITLQASENNSHSKFKLEFKFQDALGEKRYKQYDELCFFKDGNGNIHNASPLTAMTYPEEINEEIKKRHSDEN